MIYLVKFYNQSDTKKKETLFLHRTYSYKISQELNLDSFINCTFCMYFTEFLQIVNFKMQQDYLALPILL